MGGVDASVCVRLSHTDAALQGSLLKAVSVTEKKKELNDANFSKTCECAYVYECVCVCVCALYMLHTFFCI